MKKPVKILIQNSNEILKEIKIIKTKSYENLEKYLTSSKNFSGEKFGILDILIFVKIRKFISIDKHGKIAPKLTTWFKSNQESMEKNLNEILKVFL